MWIDQYMRPNQRRIDLLNAYSADRSKDFHKRCRALILANKILFNRLN